MKGIMSFLTGAMMGSLVGATLALLLAPASGEDLRQEMRDRANSIQEEMKQASALRRAELEQQLAVLRAPRKSGEA